MSWKLALVAVVAMFVGAAELWTNSAGGADADGERRDFSGREK